MGNIPGKIIAIIPARGGSKGIPRKNVKLFLGHPLLSHTIQAAIQSQRVDAVYVSTEDDEIAEVAEQSGAHTIRRPDHLAVDTATTESAIEHALEYLAKQSIFPELLVLLQATSPLRPAGAIDRAIDIFYENDCDSLLSISATHRFFWQTRDKVAVPNYDFLHRPRRQDIHPDDIRYLENGSLYIFTRQHFQDTGNRLGGKIGYIEFPESCSHEIDTHLDWIILETIARELKLVP